MTGLWLSALVVWLALIVGFLACGRSDRGTKHGG